MARLSYNDFNKSVENKFSDFELEGFNVDENGEEITDGSAPEVLRFRHMLRMPKEDRKAAQPAFVVLSASESDGEDKAIADAIMEVLGKDVDSELDGLDNSEALVAVYKRAFQALAVDKTHFEILERALGDDLILWRVLLGKYEEFYRDDAGESSPSR